MRTLHPAGWKPPIGYANGIAVAPGEIVFIAGQVGWDADQVFRSTELVPQFEQALRNVLAVLAEADTRRFQTDYLLQANYYRAFVRGDSGEMQRLLSRASDVAGAQSLLLSEQARTEAYFGRFQRARDLTRAAADLMVHEGDKESAARCLAEAAVREAEVGFSARARGYLDQAAQLSTGKDVMVVTAVAAARSGDLKRAQKLSGELDRKYPQDTLVQKYWLPVIRAALDLRQGKAPKAIDDLAPAEAIELGDATSLSLYPAYVRGQAYLAMGDARNAAMEFQKLIDHPGIVLNFQLGALSRLGRARSFSRATNSAETRDAYRDFLQFWKYADYDIPMLKQAKGEYAKLK